jgi:O-6-methylguanine DNA methyltransferase
MMVNELDAVTAALVGLRHAGSPGLEQRVFTGWLSAPSRLGEVFVAFTRDGVQFVRSAESVGGDPGTFAEAYRRRFARPLRHADRGPAGLLPALRERRGAAPRLDLSSLTAFERDVLTVTRSIPAGETRPYSWVAREAGHPTAVRAVASVLGRNPVPLLVPCHRVVRSDGSLGGYMFGPAQKNELLQGEGANLDAVADFARQGVHYLGSDTTGVVCFPTCHHARRITPAHRSGFATVGDAIAAGYRPCRSCRPALAA